MDNNLTVYFADGSEGDLARLQREYGAGIRVLRSSSAHAFRLRKINILTTGEVNLRVWVIGKDGKPVVGQAVTYTFPDLDNPDANLPALGESVASRWAARGVLNKNRTDGAGKVEFQLGDQSWIKDGRGPYAVFAISPTISSDCIDGIGWIPFTEHYGPCELFFYEEDAADDPRPLPGDDTDDDEEPTDAGNALERIAIALERLVAHFGA